MKTKGSSPPARKTRPATESPSRGQVEDKAAAAALVRGRSVKRLGRAIKRIRSEWEARAETAGTSGPESRSAYVKHAVYALVSKLKKQGASSQDILDLVAEYRGKKLRKSLLSDNPYQGVLIALFPDKGMDRSERARHARQLSYADQHEVPLAYLIGFTLLHGEAASKTHRLPVTQQQTEIGSDDRNKRTQQRRVKAAARLRQTAQKTQFERNKKLARRRRRLTL